MKYQLIIGTDNANELAPHIAIIMGNVGGSSLNLTANNMRISDGNITINHDDENGPAQTNATHDKAGIPWDERIHSKNKALNTDGTWRKRRGVSESDVATVEAELKMRGAQNAGMFMPQPNGGQQPPVAFAPQPMQQQPMFQQPPQPQFQPPQQPPQQQVQQPQFQPQQQQQFTPPMQQQQPQIQPPMDLNAFMNHLANQMQKRDANNNPLITVDYLMTVCQRLSAQFGRPFSAITDIGNDPQMIATAVNFIASDGRWN